MSETVAVEPIAPDFRATLERALGQWDTIRGFARELVDSRLDNVYFVGCGGSLCSTYPAHYVLERHVDAFSTFQMSSPEFNYRRPARLGRRSLVVVVSHSGRTPETVAAMDSGRVAGARIVAVTDHEGSPLAEGADLALTYGSEITDWVARQVLMGGLAYGLAEATGVAADYRGIRAAFEALPTALPVLLEKHEPLNHEMACALQSDPVTYVLAGGPNFGAAYCLSMCYLQEMQWMHAVSHNAGEFFHGALEMVTAEQPVIVLLGEDETRPMAERARSFVQRYSQKAFAVDTLGFDLPGVSDEHRGAITPLALASIIWRLARHFAAVRNHSLDLRRYMDKVPY